MKLYNKIDAFFEFLNPLTAMMVGFTMIIIYTKIILPNLTVSKWIITPIWILTTLSLIWRTGYRDVFKDDDKVKRRLKKHG